MYSTVKNYRNWTSRQQIGSKALTLEDSAETVLLELFAPAGLDAKLTQFSELVGDRTSEHPEEYRTFNEAQPVAQNIALYQNLSQLKHEINQLEISLIQATEETPENLAQRLHQGMENLQAKADYINGLAAQLETEMLKFKDMANKVNQDYHAFQDTHQTANPISSQPYRTRPANVWEIRDSAIPRVVKQGYQFILTSKQVFEAAADNAENRVKKAQSRQKALQCWLEAKRQRIIEDFSRP